MIEVKLTFATEAELLAFFTRSAGAIVAAPAVVPEPAPVVAKPKAEAKKADPSPVPATSPSPAPAASAPVEQAAPAATAATAAPTPAAEAAAPLVTYEASGIPAAVPAYLGAKGSDGYMARRQNVVDLLAKYNAAKGPDLKPAQFALFLAELNDLPKA